MALSADALTTVAVVLDELDAGDADPKHRARVERYINAASAFARRYCGRVFVKGAGIVENVRGFGGTRIILRRTPILSIASIVIDGETVDASAYSIEDADVGFVHRPDGWPDTSSLQPGPSYHPAPGTEAPSIVVTYDGGWVSPAQSGTRTLPEDLEDAVVQLAVTRERARGKDMRVVGVAFEKSSYTFGGVPVPAEIQGVLDRYARIGGA